MFLRRLFFLKIVVLLFFGCSNFNIFAMPQNTKPQPLRGLVELLDEHECSICGNSEDSCDEESAGGASSAAEAETTSRVYIKMPCCKQPMCLDCLHAIYTHRHGFFVPDEGYYSPETPLIAEIIPNDNNCFICPFCRQKYLDFSPALLTILESRPLFNSLQINQNHEQTLTEALKTLTQRLLHASGHEFIINLRLHINELKQTLAATRERLLTIQRAYTATQKQKEASAYSEALRQFTYVSEEKAAYNEAYRAEKTDLLLAIKMSLSETTEIDPSVIEATKKQLDEIITETGNDHRLTTETQLAVQEKIHAFERELAHITRETVPVIPRELFIEFKPSVNICDYLTFLR